MTLEVTFQQDDLYSSGQSQVRPDKDIQNLTVNGTKTSLGKVCVNNSRTDNTCL